MRLVIPLTIVVTFLTVDTVQPAINRVAMVFLRLEVDILNKMCYGPVQR